MAARLFGPKASSCSTSWALKPVTSLATPDDVARALGLEDAFALSESQSARVDDLLVRVSRKFCLEAGRPFTPGTDTVQLLSTAGSVRLPEPVAGVGDVASVVLPSGDAVDYALESPSALVVSVCGRPVPSGVLLSVTYNHAGEIPAEVVADVAAIVARHLTVEPGEGRVVAETAGPYNTRYADWVASSALFTKDDCETARSYRHPATNPIVAKL